MPRIGVLGDHSGLGGTLKRLLLSHPSVHELIVAGGEEDGDDGLGRLREQPADVLFLCQAPGRSAAAIDGISELGHRLIDLSPDFRVRDAGVFRRLRGCDHPNAEWLDRFVIGLSEHNRDRLAAARFVAMPSPGAAAILLTLLPFARMGVLASAVARVKVDGADVDPELETPVLSGIGRLARLAPPRERDFEVRQVVGTASVHSSGADPRSGAGISRGLLASSHIFVHRPILARQVAMFFQQFYAASPLMHFGSETQDLESDGGGLLGDSGYAPPVGAHTARLWIEASGVSRRMIVRCGLDAMGKGGAGAAVQCMNLMLGLPEAEGLAYICSTKM